MRFNILVITATTFLGLVVTGAVAAPIIYDYSGATQAYVVPSGITNIHVSLWGAGGGGKLAGREGAAGAYITGDLPVTPGQSLIISVGGGGNSSNFYGGSPGGFGGGGSGGFAGFGSVIFQGGAGGGGYSGIFLSSLNVANALVVAAGGGGGGGGGATSAGSLPLLAPSATPTTLPGGNGGNGGTGGPGGAGNPMGSLGIGGAGGGGAGGGYNGGSAGIAGSTGSPGTPGTPGPGGMGGPGGNGSNGGPAGSYFSLLTGFAGEVSTGSAAVGLSDPNFSALNSGFGGPVFTAGGAGRIVINPSVVPEPASLALIAMAVLPLCTSRRRNAPGATGSAAMQTPFLGSATLGTASVAQDFLDLGGASQPIGPGTYLFRTTIGTAGPTPYRFDLQVSSVPEPASLSLLAVGAGLLIRRIRKRKSVYALFG